MVQVIKRTKVKGEMFELAMSFSDVEWKIIQKHYHQKNVSFELVKEEVKPIIVTPVVEKQGRAVDDDKPNMKDYNVVKDRAMEYFREENWDKALYYLEAAHRLKSFGWLTGKINKCKNNAAADAIAKGK